LSGKSEGGTIDRRAARTRKALHEGLLRLVTRKGYEAITVQDLIEEADVGRSTFYAHYTGKEDLLRSGFAMLRAELSATEADGQAGDEPLRFSRAMFDHAGRYADVFRAMTGSRGSLVALEEIRRALSEIVRRELPKGGKDEGLPREVYVQFTVGTLLTLLTWWLEKKPGLKPAQVDAMFRRLVLQGIGDGAERR